jgi:transcriptional regulator with XRE-family HTH domain
MNHASLAESLLACRLAASATLREAAQATGVAHARISEYEHGRRTPTLARLIEVVEGLGGSVHLEIMPPLELHDRELVSMHLAMSPRSRLESLRQIARLRSAVSQ